jgi:DNA gyrase subunit A
MMLISDKGTLVRTRTDEVSVLSRNTQGVRLIKLSQEDERLVGVERIAETDAEEIDGEPIDGEVDAADSSAEEGEKGEGAGDE